MALSATIHHLQIALSDVDRGVYESLDLRVAQHPSETMRYLFARTIAYCLSYEEGIAFGRGLSSTEEPAVWVKDLRGDVRVWIEVGSPSAERLHKASKSTPRVAIFTHHDPELVLREARSRPIHRTEHIELCAIPPAFLDDLEKATTRRSRWEMVHTGGVLYVNVGDETITGEVTRRTLADL